MRCAASKGSDADVNRVTPQTVKERSSPQRRQDGSLLHPDSEPAVGPIPLTTNRPVSLTMLTERQDPPGQMVQPLQRRREDQAQG